MSDFLFVTGLLSAAILLGSMLFFSCIMAPLIFIKLDEATAGPFVRSIFPWYYLVIIGLSAVGALGLITIQPLPAVILMVIGIAAVLARQVLMPRINVHRDKMVGGNAEAENAFQGLHRLSVWINGGQLVGSVAVMFMLGMTKI
ncbi:MAG: hypothetical protein CMM45_02035 [Rhodospirillaceae bacterium]|nr:hypothetical protein [Rhodospirillaceae bacterium]